MIEIVEVDNDHNFDLFNMNYKFECLQGFLCYNVFSADGNTIDLNVEQKMSLYSLIYNMKKNFLLRLIDLVKSGCALSVHIEVERRTNIPPNQPDDIGVQSWEKKKRIIKSLFLEISNFYRLDIDSLLIIA